MHLASIAKGHPEDAVDSYKKTLGQVNGPEANIWTVGVMLYIFLAGVPSCWAENENGIFTAILRGQIDLASDPWSKLDLASDPWSKLSSGAKDLDKKMLNINPKERLTAFQVLNHPWIKEDGDAPDTPLDNVVVNRLNRLKQFRAMNQFKKAAIIDGCLSEEEITGLKEMFKNIDKDNSRTITLEYLKHRRRHALHVFYAFSRLRLMAMD